jgi:Ca2+-binding EF-hand superfamily protein
MATIADIRQQYPQYADVPDVQLADALHQKFYSDMPKTDFYKSINLTGASLIPGSITSLPAAPERSLYEKIMGNVETIPAMASAAAGGVVAPVAGLVGSLTSGKFGTQQGIQAGEQTARNVQEAMTYQPRTPEAQRNVQAIGDVLGNVIGIAPTNLLASAGSLAKPSVNQLAPVVAPATVPIKNAMVNAMQREPAAVMPGMGAAETSAAVMRQERAQRFGVPLTKGEQMPGLGLQQFESDIVKQNPEIGKPLLELKAIQKKAIVDQFEKLAEETGAEFADPAALRKVGSIVDQAVVNEFDKKFKNYKAKYQAADVAGETLQEVPYQGLVDYINKQTPTTRTSLAPILQDTLEQLKLNDPNGTGTISIRALEDVYQNIGKKAQPGTPNSTYGRDLKGLIDQTTEGAGGDLYRDARAARKQLATDFENNYRVAKLLGTKGGYADRAVALSDVFDHVVLDGSLEEMRTVTKLLKKGGPEGQQAYAELQGQTIQHLKDQMTKNASGELSFAKLKTAIDALDREGKLEYMFGKTGRDTLLDLKSTVQDALVKDPRAVNWSNTGNVVLRGLDALAAIRFPGAKTAAEIAQNAALKKKVAESVNFNALAPSKSSTNALAP